MTSEPVTPGTVLLDACVLFRGMLADLLLHLAEAGLFDPAWSPAIEFEWMRALARRRGVPEGVLAERRRLLDLAFPAAARAPDPAVVAAVEAGCRSAAQRKDAHVLAAALAAGARRIVTDNTADFPRDLLARHGVQAVRPDAFCVALLAAAPDAVVAAARRHRAGLADAAPSAGDYLALLAGRRMSLRQTARRLAGYRDRLGYRPA